MKTSDLKRPFTWEERRPLLQNGLFFVPAYYDQHHAFAFPLFESEELFGNGNPVSIEYCSGNGTWLIENALRHPGMNWVAVEKDFERVRKIWAKSQNRGLKNLLIVSGEAEALTHYYLPDQCLERIYINFPDPWPKGRHAKHRLIQPPFVEQMGRVLKPGKSAVLVTDDRTYCNQMSEVLLNSPSFTPSFPYPHYVTEWEGYGSSFFDDLWRQKGKTIHYLKFDLIFTHKISGRGTGTI